MSGAQLTDQAIHMQRSTHIVVKLPSSHAGQCWASASK